MLGVKSSLASTSPGVSNIHDDAPRSSASFARARFLSNHAICAGSLGSMRNRSPTSECWPERSPRSVGTDRMAPDPPTMMPSPGVWLYACTSESPYPPSVQSLRDTAVSSLWALPELPAATMSGNERSTSDVIARMPSASVPKMALPESSTPTWPGRSWGPAVRMPNGLLPAMVSLGDSLRIHAVTARSMSAVWGHPSSASTRRATASAAGMASATPGPLDGRVTCSQTGVCCDTGAGPVDGAGGSPMTPMPCTGTFW